MAEKVTFDGPNKLMILKPGVTDVCITECLYSPWKIWVQESDNAKYEQAFRIVGGEPTTGSNSIAPYSFLLNGWRIRPQEANHTLTVDGVVIVDGGGDPFDTLGTYNVRINMITPLQAETVETGISGLTAEESQQLADITDIAKLTGNRVTKSGDTITIYEDDGTTIWRQYDLTNGGRVEL